MAAIFNRGHQFNE